jgi:spermidine synthase
MTFIYPFLGLGLTYIIMVMIVEMFIPLGRLLGRLLNEHPETIQAYSINIAGSITGVWLFVLLSFLYQPPFTWFLIFAALTFVFLDRSHRAWRFNLSLLLGIIILSWFAGMIPNTREVVWSPYQKLVLSDVNQGKGIREYHVTVNNVSYQAMLSAKDLVAQPESLRTEFNIKGVTQYDIPFILHPDPKSILILGAGTGNDVAGALRNGVSSITGVEIDPAIISLGQRYHPDKPYASSSVNLVNDDARSFLATSEQKFDVISFGLLDAHTSTSMTNAPLDHYVYTRESISRAKSLLADGGIMTLCFEARKPYIADRIAGVLREVFGRPPIIFRIPMSHYGPGGVMFIAGDLETASARIEKNQHLSLLIEKFRNDFPLNLSYTTKITTDDWPYIFLKAPGIPLLYCLLICLTAMLIMRNRKRLGFSGRFNLPSRENWHFFFLGAGFLLLEVQNISKASVILGNTWEVNAIIVTGVLFMILAANLLTYRFADIPLKWVYFSLFALCLLLYFVDLASFAFLPYLIKASIVGSVTTLPMLFSGIIFIRSFTLVAEKDKALGANLFGALTGAMLQSITFITGIKALLLIVLLFYVLAMITSSIKSLRGQTEASNSKSLPQ